MKKRRAKKPKDAPRRPKSAYMFFLAEFREKWKVWAAPDSHPTPLTVATSVFVADRLSVVCCECKCC